MYSLRLCALVSAAVAAFSLPLASSAQAPQLINYQGRLLNGTNLVNGSVGLSLRLFDASTGGTKLYEDSNTVTVVDGLYSTLIGDDPADEAFLAALTNPEVYVEAVVNGTALAPRERLVSAGYSLTTRGLFVNDQNNVFVLNPEENAAATNAAHSTIAGGRSNGIQDGATDAFVGGGGLNSISGSWAAVIGGGWDNGIQSSSFALLGSGQGNRIQGFSQAAVLGGGDGNVIESSSACSFLGGGRANTIRNQSNHGVLGGGFGNNIQTQAAYAVLGGGHGNGILSHSSYSFLGGGNGNSIQQYAGYSCLSGGLYNTVQRDAAHAVLGGGWSNSIHTNASLSVLGGGFENVVSGTCGVVPGGLANEAGEFGFAAGNHARATHRGGFVWSDFSRTNTFGTTSSNQFLIRAGGGVGIGTEAPGAVLQLESAITNAERLRFSGTEFFQGQTSASGPTMLLGVNRPNNRQLWVADSANTEVNATNAVLRLIVLGSTAQVDAYATDGTTPRDLNLGVGMTIKSNGNVGIGTSNPTNRLHVAGTVQATAYITGSDRNAKENIAPVSADDILAKVSALPIATWNFRNDTSGTHLGPMAQDFRAAFNLGNTDSGIFTVDADGVALAAIQALAADGREQRSGFRVQQERIKSLETENEALKQQLDDVLQRLRALEEKRANVE